MQNRHKDSNMGNDKGFSTLELMIVIGLMTILSGIATLSYLTMRPAMRLNGAGQQVKGDLMKARMKAVSQNKYFKVFFIDDHQYKQCDDANNDGTVADGEGDVQLINIQEKYPGVTFTASADPVFTTRGTAINSSITISSASGTKSISVGITGRIKIN